MRKTGGSGDRGIEKALAFSIVCLFCLSIPRSLRSSSFQCPDGTPPPCAGDRVASRRAVIAVLPFDNRSGDTGKTYVADGLSDELTTRLAPLPRLVMVSSAAARRASSSSRTLGEVGRTLGAAYLLTGTVQGVGSRLRVSAELIRASSGVQLWSAQYDRPYGELLAVQGEIARSVATQVLGLLSPDERARLAVQPTASAAAYDHYLRGSSTLFTNRQPRLLAAIAAFEAAVALDTRFAAAQGRLAAAYAWAVDRDVPVPGMDRDTILARALAASERALAIDSASSDAWAGRGTSLFLQNRPDYAGAMAAMRRAVALDSDNVVAIALDMLLLRRVGSFAAAELSARRLQRLAPEEIQPYPHLAYVFWSLRRNAEAVALIDTGIMRQPDNYRYWFLRARIRMTMGDVGGALRDAQHGLNLTPDFLRDRARSIVLRARILAGDTAGLGRALDSVVRRLGRLPLAERDADYVATLAVAGRQQEAIAILERIRPRGASLWSYLVTAEFDSLRDHPRFGQILEEARPPGAPRLP